MGNRTSIAGVSWPCTVAAGTDFFEIPDGVEYGLPQGFPFVTFSVSGMNVGEPKTWNWPPLFRIPASVLRAGLLLSVDVGSVILVFKES